MTTRGQAQEELEALGYDEMILEAIHTEVAASADPDGAMSRLAPILAADPAAATRPDELQRLVAIAANSRALSQTLAANPGLLGSVPDDSISLQVRAALANIAADDLTGRIELGEATRLYSDAIDTIVDSALDRARHEVAGRHPAALEIPFTVIAMGKWGARELNYYSDIDLLFVHEAVDGDQNGSRAAGLALASRLLAILSAPTFDGPTLNVDADLRPEGAVGPLSRSIEGYASYYERWSEAWELQALLKARPAAGDPRLGDRFHDLARRIVWEGGVGPDALRSIRSIKSQTEDNAGIADIKRSRGGIRDIEFAVQMLQLVHGRFDEDLRTGSTLEAIAALEEHEYIEESEGSRLSDAYRFLRDVEHRLQLWDLQQTHQLPDAPEAMERIGRSVGLTGDAADGLRRRLHEVRSEARHLHERLYFRPILDSLAGVSTALIDREAAELRLEALGFGDVVAAATAFEELTKGLTRRSRVMQQMLPLMLDWLSLSPDPDLGLAQLRLVLANTSDHGALIGLLQGNPLAGQRLCLLLGTGRLLGELIDRIPEFVPRLADERLIDDIRDLNASIERLSGLLDSRPDPDAKMGTIRRFARRRKLRIAARDIIGEAPVESTLESLSDTADASMIGALHVAEPDGTSGLGVIAMGKWGGRELSYGSDIDLMYVFADEGGRDRALEIAAELRRILSEPSRHGEAYRLDADLRPEGRRGPLARSVESFRRYYEEWAEPWEMLALVKARPAAGDPRALSAFHDVVEPVIWKDRLTEETVRSIRQVKARVEAERIPAGEDPDFHLKLGPGGLSDIEFVTQLLQLRHGGHLIELRVTPTLLALDRLNEAGVLSDSDHRVLRDSYLFCTRVRLRLHLQRGRVSDSLPTDRAASSRLAVSLGFDRISDLREEYRRHTRRARKTFERLFYD